jgi:zinc D-Ala-D-Ala dipeptidase
MKLRLFLSFFLILALASPIFARSHMAESAAHPNLQDSSQLLIVTTKGWDDIHGTAQRYERVNGKWKKLGSQIGISVGRSGMAWGVGVYQFDRPGPIKKEGDGRSPAGVFRLTMLFSANESAHRYAHLPFIQLSPTVECVDDEKSPAYNTLVNPQQPSERTWDSSEHMLRRDSIYDFGVFVAHNSNPAKPGLGSCIFIHELGPLGQVYGTAGCTALPGDELVRLFGWLEESKNPMLVQMPKSEYKAFRKELALP